MRNKKRSLIKSFLRGSLFVLIGIILLANLFIILSGRFYLYKGIYQTYLHGRTGPSIYDKDAFYLDTVRKASDTQMWIKSPNYNKAEIPQAYKTYLKELDTKAFLVFKGDELIFENYWDGHSQSTVSNSFSAAKTIVSLLIGIALDEGKIQSLDEPVGNYIPEFNAGDKKRISIRHLLIMASGLDWQESGKNPLSENAASYYGKDLYGLVTRQKAIEAPGKRFEYQSGNSQLLGYVVEKATGMDLSAYAQEKIWKKIGTEYDAYWSLDDKEGDEKAFCCMYASARDFGRLGKLILNRGQWEGKQIVSANYMNEMFRNPDMKTDENVPNLRYGLHIWTFLGYANPVYYCRGILGQYVIAIPNEDLVIIRLGEKRKESFHIPADHKGDKDYLERHISYVGHPTDLLKYIQLGKIIEQQSK
jgi:CubicO group peptidase (beta-lactamase class C family)